MKKDIHPKFREVIFKDNSSGEMFLIGSTIEAEQEGEYEGKKYPLVEVEITSASHPFYTGNEKVLDTAGRVEKFKSRMARRANTA
jgi:large subunit ribosomal protein L31